MENDNLKWTDVPEGWALCFNNECSLAETCLRRKAAQLAPETLTVTRQVTPHAVKDGQCCHYASSEKVTFARGFQHLYDKVLKAHYTSLRESMTDMLSGKRIYYEYKRGERRLSPAQQEAIRDLFASKGYADSVVFDAFEEDYDFHWV